jgi:clathrin heavy chain
MQLSNEGITAADIDFTTLTMESEKWICVRETGGEQMQLVIVPLEKDGGRPMRRPITADGAIMNPDNMIIGLKAGRQLQLFNVEMMMMIKKNMADEDVQFWRWTDARTVGLVCERSVYEWDLETENGPVRLFDRLESLGTS